MVPNHMGIDSRWVVEHPDWFLSRPDSPYPGYTFDGADLSDDPRVGIHIEDHYWDSTDAAVVFQREDRQTGDVRYVYHGNDGTSMPWNDTAQLDYLKPEVREAVIQTILAVARRFPIIRFDAAMTLAKKHVERLWFPEPGQGGAIPSRAESAMTREAFDAAMPDEFWREVVDRVAAEVPDTLLLAEAFWLMEGYFVRTLGMHRVYNSAFMNMLRDEENAKYRLVVKNTLEFDPEILKRYVNFMNNPDEKTAVEQFGNGDKYFGVATVLATMPGLPMFGHGQVEGFAEKYGMEFRRAYWDERPNDGLVARHEREIFPLLHRRRLFAEVRDFRFYDFVDDAGPRQRGRLRLLEPERRRAGARHLPQPVRVDARADPRFGRLRREGRRRGRSTSCGPRWPTASASRATRGRWPSSATRSTGMEYIRETGDLRDRGLRVELEAYGARVLLDWREIGGEAAAEYRALAADLGGAGVPSVEAALAERRLRPLHDAVAILVNDGLVRDVTEALPAHLAAAARAKRPRLPPRIGAPPRPTQPPRPPRPARQPRPRPRPRPPSRRTSTPSSTRGAPGRSTRCERIRAVTRPTVPDVALEEQAARFGDAPPRGASTPPSSCQHRAGCTTDGAPAPAATAAHPAAPDASRAFVAAALPPDTATWGALLGWLAADAIAVVLEPDPDARVARGWFDRARLGRVFADAYRWRGLDERAAWWTVETVRHLVARPGAAALVAPAGERAGRLVRAWFADDDLGRWLGVNRHEGIAYLNRESFEAALRWMVVLVAVDGPPEGREDDGHDDIAAGLGRRSRARAATCADAEAAGYEVGRLVELATA